MNNSCIFVDRTEYIIRLKDIFVDCDSLGLRESGLLIRQIIEENLKFNDYVTIDFEGIWLITQGFADEIIGVIVRNKGVDFVKNKIKVVNANDFIRNTLNWVVSYSKKMAQNTSSS